MLTKGKNVFIRTVSMHQIGRVRRVTRSWIDLESGLWVADSWRFGRALAEGASALVEVEVIPGDGRITVSRGAVVDVYAWNHPLPTQTK